MKISTLLTIALLALGSILAGFVGQSTLVSVQNYNQVQQLRDLVALRGIWFDGLTSLSLERSLSQVQLSIEKGQDGAIAQLRAEQRAHTKAIFDDFGAKMLAGEEFGMRDELYEDMQISLNSINDAHAAIDALMQQDLASRDPVQMVALIDTIKDQIVEMKGMSVHLVMENDFTSTQTNLLSRIEETVFDTREYAGRARSIYAIAVLHGRSLSEKEQLYVKETLHRASEAWAGVEHVTETVEVPGPITEQIAKTEALLAQGYYSLLADLDGQIAAAAPPADATTSAADLSTYPVPYSISFDNFFANTSSALAAPSQLIDVTSQELDKIWEDRATNKRNWVIFDLCILLGTLILIGATVWVISRKVTQKLATSLDNLAALTAGTLDMDLTPPAGDLHEMKALAQGLGDLQQQLQRAAQAQADLAKSESAQQHIVTRLSAALTELAAGNLSVRLTDTFDPKYQNLADNFNAASEALARVVAQVVDTASTILSGTRGINEATVELSHRTETQGVTLQNAAAALEQLTRNIVGSQADATELDALASLASEKGTAMTATMSQTVEAIEKIKSSSQQIEQIVGVIEDIAFQTNLLALNAGVEATRAGAEGSGFAVIASEVRSLAERSAQSAQDIKNLIAASGVEVSKGVEFVAEAEASVGDIGAHIKMISSLISRIATAASEQSQGLVKVNDGVSQLDLVTQTNVAMVEETTAECASLASVAQELSQLVARFRVGQSQGAAFAPQANAA